MPTTERRARYKTGVQAEILGAAREIFVQEGYENFSMRALAQRIGYSTAATYKHFKSKKRIILLLMERLLLGKKDYQIFSCCNRALI